ncbi:MAG: PorP/SprF family type IX secretion system membrane protein [Flavobacteriales bacterium]
MMKRLIYHVMLLLLFLVAIMETYAQDVHFSQFFNTPLIQNPAMAGAINNFEANVNYRSQWSSVTVPFKTLAASAGIKINKGSSRKGHWAAGVQFFNDQGGDGTLKTTSGNAALVHHIKLSKYQKLGLGLSAGFGQRSIVYDNFEWGSQYTGTSYNSALPVGEYLPNNNIAYLDLSSGIVYSFNNTSGNIKVTTNNFKQGTIGFAIHHLNKPQYSFVEGEDRMHRKYVLHGDFLFSLKNTPLALQPGFSIYQQGPSREINLGSLVRYELLPDSKYTGYFQGAGISLGGYYRYKDAVVLAGMLEFAQYSFGFSYDLNTSKLVAASGGRGAMEFTIRIINQNPYFKKTRVF